MEGNSKYRSISMLS